MLTTSLMPLLARALQGTKTWRIFTHVPVDRRVKRNRGFTPIETSVDSTAYCVPCAIPGPHEVEIHLR